MNNNTTLDMAVAAFKMATGNVDQQYMKENCTTDYYTLKKGKVVPRYDSLYNNKKEYLPKYNTMREVYV